MTDLISLADAIEAVQDHFNDNGFKGYDDGQKMMDRIKALPSAPTDGDLISRQDAIDAMSVINDSICEQQAIDALCELPSARPTHKPDYTYEAEMVQRLQKLMAGARPTGKWINKGIRKYKNTYPIIRLECPICHKIRFIDLGEYFPKFCEECGADMRIK